MPVTGADAVRKNMRRTFKYISEKKAVQFVTAVVSIGASQSKEFAPVEYSTLVNSQTMEVNQTKTGVTGKVSFNTNYAAILEFSETWNNRPVEDKQGPAWNPNGRPHYLRDGFEVAASRQAINKAIDIFKV